MPVFSHDSGPAVGWVARQEYTWATELSRGRSSAWELRYTKTRRTCQGGDAPMTEGKGGEGKQGHQKQCSACG